MKLQKFYLEKKYAQDLLIMYLQNQHSWLSSYRYNQITWTFITN